MFKFKEGKRVVFRKGTEYYTGTILACSYDDRDEEEYGEQIIYSIQPSCLILPNKVFIPESQIEFETEIGYDKSLTEEFILSLKNQNEDKNVITLLTSEEIPDCCGSCYNFRFSKTGEQPFCNRNEVPVCMFGKCGFYNRKYIFR